MKPKTNLEDRTASISDALDKAYTALVDIPWQLDHLASEHDLVDDGQSKVEMFIDAAEDLVTAMGHLINDFTEESWQLEEATEE